MSPRNSEDVAKEVGIGIATLERWLAQSKIKSPKTVTIGKRRFRLWSERDIERLKKHKATFYQKGRGRKVEPKK